MTRCVEWKIIIIKVAHMNRLQTIKALVLIAAVLSSPLSFAKASTQIDKAVNTTEKLVSDTTITSKIKGLYVSEKVFGDKDISVMGVNVETTNGIVRLTGTVTNETQADNAIKIAKAVVGVKRVIFNLKVNPTS
jgi:hyperosmotically inducible protein